MNKNRMRTLNARVLLKKSSYGPKYSHSSQRFCFFFIFRKIRSVVGDLNDFNCETSNVPTNKSKWLMMCSK